MRHPALPSGTKEKARELFGQGLTPQEVSAKTGMSVPYAHRLRRAWGFDTSVRRKPPVPENFLEQVELLGSRRSLCAKFGVGDVTLAHWCEVSGIPLPRGSGGGPAHKAPLPERWYELAPRMTKKDAENMWGLNWKALTRMSEETGIRFKAYREPKSILSRMGRPQRTFTAPLLNDTERAANFLRRLFPNVHRADLPLYDGHKTTWGESKGLPARGRGYYHVSGIGEIPSSQLVELARQKGWAEA